MISHDRLEALVEGIIPQSVELRRLLHRHPEPANEEHQTTALIAASLDENGIAYQDRRPDTGLWLDIGPEPLIGFRADLDALPIFEPEENAPRSQNPGWMHACGHDGHAAIAFGIAVALRQLATEPPQVSLAHMQLTFPPVARFLERFRAVLLHRRRFALDEELRGLSRLEQASAFLALLELRKLDELRIEQREAFGPIGVFRPDVERSAA